MNIEVRIDELLEQKGRTFYWLSKQSKISHSTLWRLKKGKALGINFVTLKSICQALECEPGDILKLGTGNKQTEEKKVKKAESANYD